MKIEIKDKIREILQKKIEDSDEFNSVEEYINYILLQITDKLKKQKSSNQNSNEEKEIKKRLTSLGYMD